MVNVFIRNLVRALGVTLREGLRIALLMLVALAAYSDTIEVPNTFVNGEVADAGQVNANFDALVTESNLQDGRLDSLETAPPANTNTILMECFGPGLVSCTCPVSHPFLMGGACERLTCFFGGFGPSTSITGSPPDTYSCVSIGAICPVEVDIICST